MRLCIISLITTLLILPMTTRQSEAQVIEKDTHRFFSVGPREFPVSSNNRLSDESADEILRMIQREYEGKAEKTSHIVWRHLHKVYNGPIYDDILFYAFKIKMDNLFRCLRKPSEIYNSNRTYEYGRLIWWEMEIENTGETQTGAFKLQNLFIEKNKWYRTWKGSLQYATWNEGIWLVDKFSYIYFQNHDRPILSKSAEEKQAKNELYPMLQSEIDKRKFSLREKAINSLIEAVIDHCDHFIRQTDPSADTRIRNWDNLMVKIPEIPLSLSDECGEETAKIVSNRLTAAVAGFTLTPEGQNKLILFAKEHEVYEELQFPETTKRLF